MRVLNWALDAQKTVGGKIISVILSVALIFSFSNFFYGDNAFATEDNPSEFSELNDKPAVEENDVDTAVSVQASEQQPAAGAEKTASNVAADPEASQDVTVKLQLPETATVIYKDKKVTEQTLTAPAKEDLAFKVSANEGNVVTKVKAGNKVLEAANGIYTVSAADLANNLTIAVETEAVSQGSNNGQISSNNTNNNLSATPLAESTSNLVQTINSLVDDFTSALFGNGVQPMAEVNGNTITLTVGEKYELKCEQKGKKHKHDWKIIDKSIVSQNDDETDDDEFKIKAVSPGSTVVSCGNTSYTIKVNPAPVETVRIYVYIQIDGDTSGWTLNNEGWFTIGYMDVPTTVLDHNPSNGTEKSNADVAEYLKNIVRHSSNANISINYDDIDWTHFGLHAASGASDYNPTATKYTWHLDGYYKIKQAAKYTASVEYKKDAGIEAVIPEPITQSDLNSGEK